MSLARLLITAVVVEGRSKSEVARDYRVSRYWVQTLVKRFQAEGEAAFEPRSRRPHRSPQQVSAELEDRIIRLRRELSKKGLDAGAETIRAHLARTTAGRQPIPAVATIWRVLVRRGFVTPQPQKRPKSSYRRFGSCPTSAGRPTPPTGSWPPAAAASCARSRSSTSSTTTPGSTWPPTPIPPPPAPTR